MSLLPIILVYLPRSREIRPKYDHRLGECNFRFCIVLWKMTETIHQRRTEYVGQILAMHCTHALWIIAILCLIVKDIEVAAARLRTRRSWGWSCATTRAATSRYGWRWIGSQLIPGAYNWRHELSVRKRCDGSVTCIDRMLRGTIPVGVLVDDLWREANANGEMK